ncbi:cobyric acid synthase [Streptomyces malaysiensis subsp. malaysiensis]|uniref:Cobyric acid synthase n=1 Tax=Streptomyces malaysiensis TaxID=92644 RepID=A0ABX6W3R7_STRMQ|nr:MULTISPECIES: cobyric acid synthase [Streptomyces]WPB93986.1 cobyric acid synthase [Streptomyces malaysiensis]AUA14651.1 Cobyric acid synthase [Streptomyces sp. M56]MCD9588508.1 cobyric acid synthase [Streptomyces sp. 8ZJF_21]MYX56345.1 cobyric acid synthase [Streptomyces sp. SID8382]QPI55583.1 cobyric acid synthase [Streptomyces solisilvae]
MSGIRGKGGTDGSGSRGGGLLVAGTTSDAGKSVVTAGICRWLARKGVSVAPFKAQNMSLNSFVTREGAEIGRAQAMQAAAARVEPSALMNPVLLKPGSDRSSQVVLLGKPVGELSARGYFGRPGTPARPGPAVRPPSGAVSPGEAAKGREALLGTVTECLEELRRTHDAVICEGAGSPAEINLRRTDIVNMGLARAAGLPVVVVGDIDRGGVFASFFGTTALLSAADQRHVAAYLVNKFRGDVSLLEPGLEMLRDLTGRPTVGVLPFAHGLGIDEEDGLRVSLRGTVRESVVAPPYGADVLRIAVAAVPLMSNFTDVDALAAEPGVVVRFVDRPEELADADLVVLPGTRGTVRALEWLRERGLAGAIARRAAEGRPVLGVCGGFQMLGERIEDEVESRAGTVAGLGLLPVRVRFAAEKTLARPVGEALGERVEGYEIHHGVAEPLDGAEEPFLDGCRVGSVWGTHWHGSLESDGFRRAFLRRVADAAGRAFVPAPDTRFGELREEQLDRLGDLIEEHADTDALLRLIEGGVPEGLPFVPPGAPGGTS